MDNKTQSDLNQEKPTKSTLWLAVMIIIYGFLGTVLFALPLGLILIGFIFSLQLSQAGIVTFVEKHYWYFYILQLIALLGQILGIRYGVNDVSRKSKIETERIPKIVLSIALILAVLNLPRIFTNNLQGFAISIVIIAIPFLAAWYFLRQRGESKNY